MARPDPISSAYRERLRAVRAEISRRLEQLYGESVDPAAIARSFEAFIAEADTLISAGQTSVAALTEAYLQSRAASAGVELDLDSLEDLAGTSRTGRPLADVMAPYGPMVLAAIAEGRDVGDALEYGRFLATNMADAELVGTADRIQDSDAVRSKLTGWLGIPSPDACDPCLTENEGIHPVDWSPYRHGNCGCLVEPVFEEAG